jgi:hypothetical protein
MGLRKGWQRNVYRLAAVGIAFALGFALSSPIHLHPAWLAGTTLAAAVLLELVVTTLAGRWVSRRLARPYDGNDRSRVFPHE